MYSPKVAVIDSGVDKANKIIMAHVVEGFAFTNDIENNQIIESDDYDDILGHGTNCIDCILQEASKTQFYPIKIVNEYGKTTSELLIMALKKCMYLPIDIVCISLSVTCLIDKKIEAKLKENCRQLAEQGKIICASECNNMQNTVPAIFDSVIGVKAFNDKEEKKISVNESVPVQIMTDVSPIFVAGKCEKYNFFKGTSKGNAYIVGMLANAMQKGKKIHNLHQALIELKNISITSEIKGSENVGKIQSDELGIIILKKIKDQLVKAGCVYSMEEVSGYPLFSGVTGVNFFNFYDFVTELYRELGIAEFDYHSIKIREVCTLYDLVEHLKGKINYEKEEYSV